MNPATHFGATGGSVSPGYAPMMGQSIADAGALLASGIDSAQHLRLEKTRLEQEKAALDKALKREVIRPTVGGIYQQRRYNQPLLQNQQRQHNDADDNHDSEVVSDTDVIRGDVSGNKLAVAGFHPVTAADTTDAEIFEERYGDFGGSLLGLGVMVRDGLQNTYQLGKNIGNKLDERRVSKWVTREAKRQSETSSGARRKWSKLQRHRGMTHAQ